MTKTETSALERIREDIKLRLQFAYSSFAYKSSWILKIFFEVEFSDAEDNDNAKYRAWNPSYTFILDPFV